MLVGALSDEEGALRASLQAVYGIRLLPGGRTEPYRSPAEVGDLVANLPPGCALWVATGGPLAWTAETHMLAMVEFATRQQVWMQTKDGQDGKNRPKPISPPKSVREVEAGRERNRARAERTRIKQAARQVGQEPN